MPFRVKLSVLMAIVAQLSPSPPHSPPPAGAGLHRSVLTA